MYRYLTLLLLLFSYTSFGQEVIAKVTEPFYQQHFADSPTLFKFSNGDTLLLIELSEIEPFLGQNGLLSIEQNQQLEFISPQPSLRSYAAVTPQSGTKIARFDELTSAQRSCDLVKIAVLDSGVDTSHAYLSHVAFDAPYNAITQLESVTDDYGHGTHVTGIITSFPWAEQEIEGGCSNATIMPIRFLGSTGGGSIAHAIEGISWAIDNNAQIINHSWVVVSYSQPLFEVIQEADNLGIIQIAAAGNSGVSLYHSTAYPASFANDLQHMVSVANWDDDSQSIASNSNYQWSLVNIAAPGTNISSLIPNGDAEIQSGTSMAAPWVSAAVATYWQTRREQSASQVVSALLQSAQSLEELDGEVENGAFLDAYALSNQDDITPQILKLERLTDEFLLSGFELQDVVTLRYLSSAIVDGAQDSYLAFSKVQADDDSTYLTTANWDMPAGYFELTTADGEQSQKAFLPDVPTPQNVTYSELNSGQLVSWQGSDYAQKFHIYKRESYSYRKIATVDAPTNQYYDEESELDPQYVVSQEYSVNIGDRTFTYTSEKSDLSVEGEADEDSTLELMSDSRCFIASSLYKQQPHKVAFYREFRDNVLLNLPFGESLVEFYYKHSPSWVEWSHNYPWLRQSVTWILDIPYEILHDESN